MCDILNPPVSQIPRCLNRIRVKSLSEPQGWSWGSCFQLLASSTTRRNPQVSGSTPQKSPGTPLCVLIESIHNKPLNQSTDTYPPTSCSQGGSWSPHKHRSGVSSQVPVYLPTMLCVWPQLHYNSVCFHLPHRRSLGGETLERLHLLITGFIPDNHSVLLCVSYSSYP